MKLLICLVTIILLVSAYAEDLTIGSFNIKNYNYDPRTQTYTNDGKLLEIISEINPDIMAFQEIVNTDAFKNLITKNFKNYNVITSICGGFGKQKLGLIYNKKKVALASLAEVKELSMSDKCDQGLRPGLVARLKDRKTHKPFYLFVTHLKAGASNQAADIRKQQLNIISKTITKLQKKSNAPLIILGDFNTTHFNSHDEYHQNFLNFVSKNDLTDFSDEIKCSSYWWGGSADGLEYPGILDHIMINNELKNQFTSIHASSEAHCKKSACDIVPSDDLGITYKEVSDHCPITLTLKQ